MTSAETKPSQGMAAVFGAAVVNKDFRKLLLRNPEQAVTHGYAGESFNLTPDELLFFKTTQARSLPDLAQQWNARHGS